MIRLSKIQRMKETVRFLGSVSSHELMKMFPTWSVKSLQGVMDYLENRGEVQKSRMNKGQGSFIYFLKLDKRKNKEVGESKVGPPIIWALPKRPFTTAEKVPVIQAVYEMDGEFTAAELLKVIKGRGTFSADKLRRMIPQLIEEGVLVALKSYQNRYGKICNIYERGDKDD